MTPRPLGSDERRLAGRVQRRWPLVSAVGALGLALLLGAVIAGRGGRLSIDTEWMAELVEHRAPFWQVPALVMNFVGGGWFGVFAVPVGIGVALLLARKPWATLYFVAASVASAGVVQLLKQLFGRARPEDILVVSDYGSFPSGHVANAATIAVALGVILRRSWVWAAGVVYTLLMIASRTYLGAHWLTDTLGGVLVGAGVAVVLWAPFALRLLAERHQRENLTQAARDS
ncbi:hypothetical protein GCM10025867_39170 [Frondihabitans sucicola]|uniref:Phosphatidic acid phosphatase type 2/haloperoxidase domain-containing protein n=1 Tax=Frondihabitans sucicola TaxID=1268041 RepID=A0ABM8GT83_9MICO|nr:phosphatase PAP2 family protein [Frondihabitans sucicola]BDZ51676.1 hypothetical protein GCM10025867_39170 [Frondihabitans sucicola]